MSLFKQRRLFENEIIRTTRHLGVRKSQPRRATFQFYSKIAPKIMLLMMIKLRTREWWLHIHFWYLVVVAVDVVVVVLVVGDVVVLVDVELSKSSSKGLKEANKYSKERDKKKYS